MKCLTRRADAGHIDALRTLRFSLLVIAGISVSSCRLLDDESSCGKETLSALNLTSGQEALQTSNRTTSFVGGRRIHTWDLLVENVCSDEHARGSWTLRVDTNELPSGWTVEAGYLITALSGSTVPLTTLEVATGIREYSVMSDVGLSQAFDDATGRFLMYLEVSHTSTGNISDDNDVVRRAIRQLSLLAGYKEPKTN